MLGQHLFLPVRSTNRPCSPRPAAQVLTIDRTDDAGQGEVTAKLPGFTGASGLPSSKEAQKILEAKRQAGDSSADENEAANPPAGANGYQHGREARLGADAGSYLGPRLVGHDNV